MFRFVIHKHRHGPDKYIRREIEDVDNRFAVMYLRDRCKTHKPGSVAQDFQNVHLKKGRTNLCYVVVGSVNSTFATTDRTMKVVFEGVALS